MVAIRGKSGFWRKNRPSEFSTFSTKSAQRSRDHAHTRTTALTPAAAVDILSRAYGLRSAFRGISGAGKRLYQPGSSGLHFRIADPLEILHNPKCATIVSAMFKVVQRSVFTNTPEEVSDIDLQGC